MPGSDLQHPHQLIVGLFLPLTGIECRVETFYLGDVHKLVLHVTFEQQPDVAAQCRRHRLYVLAEDEAFAGTRLQVSAQDVDGRRLARTVLAQQPEDTSAGHLEAQVFIDFPFPIVMGQVFAC